MKLLHITTDEKFIDSIYWQFNEVFEGQNKFIVFLDNNVTSPKYVTLNNNFITIKKDENGLEYCLEKVLENDLVILHGLNYFQSQIVLQSKNRDKFIWFFWGGEFYDNPKAIQNEILGIKTKSHFLKTFLFHKIKTYLKPIFYHLKYATKIPELMILEAARNLKHFGVIHKEEVDFLKKRNLLSQNVNHLTMTYYPLEFIFKGIENMKIQGDNILVGNSASMSNNHLEAFDLLEPLQINERKIIVPLSYGNKEYAQSICKEGRHVFGKSFEPLLNFMPLEKYNIIISQCSIVIMNHYRQQSVGNIVAMIWMGSRVYLDERNTFYHYLKRIGVVVFSIKKDLNKDNEKVLSGLSQSEKSLNRELLKLNIGFNTIKKQLHKYITEIINEH